MAQVDGRQSGVGAGADVAVVVVGGGDGWLLARQESNHWMRQTCAAADYDDDVGSVGVGAAVAAVVLVATNGGGFAEQRLVRVSDSGSCVAAVAAAVAV